MQLFIGIDPGASGGIALLDARGRVVWVVKMPDTDQDLLGMLTKWPADGWAARAVVERVHGGIGRQGASGMFNYGRNYGAVLMALAAGQVPFDTVPPQRWQKLLGVTYPKGATQTERKNISKRRAQQLFPAITVTHAIADALLLADYCRRTAGALRDEDSIHGEEEVSEEDRALEARARESREAFEADEQQTAKERRAAQAAPAETAARHGAGARSDPRPLLRKHRRHA
jgi:hypothetical protein